MANKHCEISFDPPEIIADALAIVAAKIALPTGTTQELICYVAVNWEQYLPIAQEVIAQLDGAGYVQLKKRIKDERSI